MVSGRCLEVVWKVSGRCLEGVLKVSERCLEGIWKMSGGSYPFLAAMSSSRSDGVTQSVRSCVRSSVPFFFF